MRFSNSPVLGALAFVFVGFGVLDVSGGCSGVWGMPGTVLIESELGGNELLMLEEIVGGVGFLFHAP